MSALRDCPYTCSKTNFGTASWYCYLTARSPSRGDFGLLFQSDAATGKDHCLFAICARAWPPAAERPPGRSAERECEDRFPPPTIRTFTVRTSGENGCSKNSATEPRKPSLGCPLTGYVRARPGLTSQNHAPTDVTSVRARIDCSRPFRQCSSASRLAKRRMRQASRDGRSISHRLWDWRRPRPMGSPRRPIDLPPYPGTPTVIPENKPGAGGYVAASYLYAVAPKDGTVFGLIGRDTPLGRITNASGARFEPRKMSWLVMLTTRRMYASR